MAESALQRARREWREKQEAEKRAASSIIDASVAPTGGPTENPLALSSLMKKEGEREHASMYGEEIRKCIMVRNIPIHDPNAEQQLRALFTVPGGIFALRFYPKGETRNALIQFNTHTEFHTNTINSYGIVCGASVDVTPATICVKQFQNIKYQNFDEQIIKRAEHERQEATKQVEELKKVKLEDVKDQEILALKTQIINLQTELKIQQAEKKHMSELIFKMSAALIDAEEPQRSTNPVLLDISEINSTQTQPQKAVPQKPALTEEEQNRALIASLLASDRIDREKELEKKLYLCPICWTDYPISEIYVLDGCYHRYCRECLTGWCESKILEADVMSIGCPDQTCGHQLSHQEVVMIIKDKDLVAKFEKFSLSKALEAIPNLRWCPQPGCGMAMIGHKGTIMMRCPNDSCRFCFCFQCQEKWHADLSCAQYQAWKKDMAAGGVDSLRKWIEANAKMCPKCNSPIEKNGGCNHMTCMKCKHEFCWICRADYDHGNHFQNSACSQWS